MVPLVFWPYTQVWRSICTSEPLRASTRVLSGFTLLRHSSPSMLADALWLHQTGHLSEAGGTGQWCAHDLASGSHLGSVRHACFTFIAQSFMINLHVRTAEWFHILLNSLFKVLFNFPSKYLFAIGLVQVFSLRWGVPPALGCILKQPDSWDAGGLGPARQPRA